MDLENMMIDEDGVDEVEQEQVVEQEDIDDEVSGSDEESQKEADINEDYHRILKEKDKLKRALYSQSHKIEQLKKEREDLLGNQQELVTQTQDAQRERLEHDLNRAKAKLAIAAQENNPMDMADANVELSKISARMSYLERDEELRSVQHRDESDHRQNLDEMAELWASLNEDLIPGTQSFNPNLSKVVTSALQDFHKNIYEANQQHLLGTAEYWSVVDQINEQARRSFKDNTRLNVSGNSYAQPARSASYSGVNGVKKPALTKQELQDSKFWGVTPEAYLKAKMGL